MLTHGGSTEPRPSGSERRFRNDRDNLLECILLLLFSEGEFEARFEDEARFGGSQADADAEAPDEIIGDFPVGAGQELVESGADGAVVFQARGDAFPSFVANSRGGFEAPAVAGPGAVEGALAYGVEVGLPLAYGLFEDGADFDAAGVLFVDGFLERELGDESEFEGQVPGARGVEMREDAPARIFESISGTDGVELHEADGGVVGESGGELEGRVELVLSGGESAVESPGADADVVEMGFEGELKGFEGFVFVDVNFEGILGGEGCSE